MSFSLDFFLLNSTHEDPAFPKRVIVLVTPAAQRRLAAEAAEGQKPKIRKYGPRWSHSA